MDQTSCVRTQLSLVKFTCFPWAPNFVSMPHRNHHSWQIEQMPPMYDYLICPKSSRCCRFLNLKSVHQGYFISFIRQNNCRNHKLNKLCLPLKNCRISVSFEFHGRPSSRNTLSSCDSFCMSFKTMKSCLLVSKTVNEKNQNRINGFDFQKKMYQISSQSSRSMSCAGDIVKLCKHWYQL